MGTAVGDENQFMTLEHPTNANDSTIEECLRDLSSTDVECQEQAIERLRILGEKAVPALVRGLTICSGYRCRLICDALGEMGSAACDLLSDLLAGEDAYDREWALFAFGAMRQFARPASGVLRKATNDSAARVRIEAVRVLHAIGEGLDSEIEILVAGMSDADPLVQLRSVLYLTEFDSRSVEIATPALISALSHSEPEIRQYAAQALGRLVPIPQVVATAVGALLLDENPQVREEAGNVLNSAWGHEPRT